MTDHVYAWIDLETTGLLARQEKVLSVACILTDTRLNHLVDEPFTATVQYTASTVQRMKYHSDPLVQEMHERTGLWDELSSDKSLSLKEVEASLLDYIKQAAPRSSQARIAGSSIRLDLNFLEEHLPSVYRHLHYRSLDVSGLSDSLTFYGLVGQREKVKPEHSALSDITASIKLFQSTLTELERLAYRL